MEGADVRENGDGELDRFLPLGAVCGTLGISPSTLKHLLSAGHLNRIRVGKGCVRVSEAALR